VHIWQIILFLLSENTCLAHANLHPESLCNGKSFLSVDVTDDDSVCFVRPNNKNFCSKVPFSFCDLFCQIIFVHCMWQTTLFNNIIPTIREYVSSARKFAPRIPLQWKNNSCESINPILKLNQNWAPEKLPELINKIHKEIILQENIINIIKHYGRDILIIYYIQAIYMKLALDIFFNLFQSVFNAWKCFSIFHPFFLSWFLN
jgi:hypothetical protein